MQKLRALLPRASFSAADSQHYGSGGDPTISLEPEIGFQITIEPHTVNIGNTDTATTASSTKPITTTVTATLPQLNVHLIAARHLPTLFGFKIVQGYLIKVKLFPGSKRLDSSIQTNSWPKFNENFHFPLQPDRKSAMKQSGRRSSRTSSLLGTSPAAADFTPDELFEGQFVVFTVYALLELPPVTFNRLNRTYRSLRDKGSNFVQRVVDGSGKEDKENGGVQTAERTTEGTDRKSQKKRKSEGAPNPRDAMPPLTISESRRNIGSVTCYLEAKLFRRHPRSGLYVTDELWLPIKDITTTTTTNATKSGAVAAISSSSNNNNNPTNAPKGVVEIVLELHDLAAAAAVSTDVASPIESPCHSNGSVSGDGNTRSAGQWSRVRSEMRRKMGISNAAKPGDGHQLLLRITTARMRCSQRVKDELEATAGSVYVKTTLYEHGIYVDSWKSSPFYPSLSTKWAEVGGGSTAQAQASSTLSVPLSSSSAIEHLLVRTTLATKTKLGKKLVLGTILVGAHVRPHGLSLAFGGAGGAATSGAEHVRELMQAPFDEQVPMWHCFQ